MNNPFVFLPKSVLIALVFFVPAVSAFTLLGITAFTDACVRFELGGETWALVEVTGCAAEAVSSGEDKSAQQYRP